MSFVIYTIIGITILVLVGRSDQLERRNVELENECFTLRNEIEYLKSPLSNDFLYRWSRSNLSDIEYENIMSWLLDNDSDSVEWTANSANVQFGHILFDENEISVRITNPNKAMLFKLTFGGAA